MADEKGWAFPVSADPLTGRINEISGEAKIHQSIRMILTTNPGERFFYPAFGCDLRKYVFGTADYTTMKMLEKEVTSSIKRWEKRLSFLEVRASVVDGVQIRLDIDYKIQNIDSMYSYTHLLDLR